MPTKPYDQRVKSVMSRDVVSLNANDTVHDALNLIVENRVAALPVIDRRGQCVGMLSTTDLIDLTKDLEDDLNQLDEVDRFESGWLFDKLRSGAGHEPVSGVMSESVATIGLDASIVDAAREMLRNRVHRLPVVDANNRLVGIISTMDIMSAFVAGAPK